MCLETRINRLTQKQDANERNSSNELDKWIAAHPNTLQSIYQAYKETIPEISKNFRNKLPPHKDHQFMEKLHKNHHIANGKNHHIVNSSFETDPQYLAAYYQKDNIVGITVLYVFPEHRGNNYGRTIIEQLKLAVQNVGCILQVGSLRRHPSQQNQIITY